MTSNRTYASNAINIYNAWSATLANVAGTDAQLEANTAAGLRAGAEILRVGNSFSAYYSANGTSWTKLGSTEQSSKIKSVDDPA